MFNWFKKEKPTQASSPVTIRDTLFGDLPISEWPRDPHTTGEPWVSFLQARNHVDAKNNAAAIAILKKDHGDNWT